MDKFDPNMRGVLFKNDKGENAKRPDFRGSCVINNVDFNVSGWKKVSQKTGDAYLSLKFEAKGEPQRQPTKKPEITEKNWDDLDTPF